MPSLFSAALLAAAAAASTAAAAPAAPSAPAPNFVFILSESLDGRLLRPDSSARIPNIRSLLSSGSIRFDGAYANSPVCAPSRSSLWSGRAPHKIAHMHNGLNVSGVWNNYEGLDPTYNSRLDQLLSSQGGYSTAIHGKTDYTVGGHTLSAMLSSLTMSVPWPYSINASGGWNEEDPSLCGTQAPVAPGGSGGAAGSLYGGDWMTVNEVSKFVATAAEPFFAFAGTNILHPPYGTNEYWYSRAAPNVSIPPWPPLESLHPCDLQAAMRRGCTPTSSNASAYEAFYAQERLQHVQRVYLAELEEFDAMVGRVYAALQARNTSAPWYLILAADHGDMRMRFPVATYKMVPRDGAARVPLAIASPTLAAMGATVIEAATQPVQLLDIFPTVLDLASLPVPSYADGYSLVPFLRGAAHDPSRPSFVVSQNADEDIAMPWWAVTDGTYKLVQYGTGAEVPPQLFNLSADPDELSDVHNASATYVAIATQLEGSLRSAIDYPAVAMDIAAYQKDMFRWWMTNGTANWKQDIASPAVRWHPAWSQYPQQALNAVESWVESGAPAIRACDGRLSTYGDAESAVSAAGR